MFSCASFILYELLNLKDGRHSIKGLADVGDYGDDRGFHLVWKITDILKISCDKDARDSDKRTQIVAFHNLNTFWGAFFWTIVIFPVYLYLYFIAQCRKGLTQHEIEKSTVGSTALDEGYLDSVLFLLEFLFLLEVCCWKKVFITKLISWENKRNYTIHGVLY